MPTHDRSAMRPPRQARSRDTLERIVAAAGRLMDDRDFGAISVADIASEAGSSVGAFYARFRDKAALLDYVEQATRDEIGEFSRERNDAGAVPLHGAVTDMISFLVRLHRRRRGILRALTLRDRAWSDEEGLDGESALLDLTTTILRRRGEIGHPSPDHAVQLGFAMILGAVRERVLFGRPQPGHLPIPDRLLVEELSRAFLSYLAA